jgi:hypothetical protein
VSRSLPYERGVLPCEKVFLREEKRCRTCFGPFCVRLRNSAADPHRRADEAHGRNHSGQLDRGGSVSLRYLVSDRSANRETIDIEALTQDTLMQRP